jgi:hypothetical protein
VFTIPILAFTMTDPGVHDGVIRAFMMDRNPQMKSIVYAGRPSGCFAA